MPVGTKFGEIDLQISRHGATTSAHAEVSFEMPDGWTMRTYHGLGSTMKGKSNPTNLPFAAEKLAVARALKDLARNLEAEAYAEVATPSRDMSVNTMLRGFTDGSLKELANGSMDELVHRFEKAERARMRRENAMEDPLCKQKRLDRIAKKLTEMGLEVKAIDRQGDMSVNVNKVLYD